MLDILCDLNFHSWVKIKLTTWKGLGTYCGNNYWEIEEVQQCLRCGLQRKRITNKYRPPENGMHIFLGNPILWRSKWIYLTDEDESEAGDEIRQV